MNALSQSNFLQALGWAVLNSLWQMALLWVVYQIITGVFRKSAPAHKSSLATCLLAGGFIWFGYTFVSILLSKASGDTTLAAGFTSVEGNHQLNDWMNRTLPVASMLYLFLLVFPVLHYIRNYRYVQVIRNYGLSKADVEWRMFVRRISSQIGITKKVSIWVSEFVNSPVTIGFIKPIILVPAAAINNLTQQQMEAVLLHELAHIRRYDYFINLLIKFIQAILYFNPFVKSFVSIIEREREKSCDDLVMQFQYDPHGYASALLVLEKEMRINRPLAVGASGKKQDLLHRIEWIMGVRKQSVVSFNKLAGLMAGLLFIIALNAVLILSKPSTRTMPVASSFSALTSPLYFFTDDFMSSESEPQETPVILEEMPRPTIVNTPAEEKIKKTKTPVRKEKQKIDMEALAERVNYFTSNPYAAAVAYVDHPAIPVLTPEQAKQVQGAIDASKKVLTEGQWREVERTIGEVLTSQQKDALRKAHKKQMSKLDWKKIEDKLSVAYNQIDWETINSQLAMAVNNIRMDSLNEVYAKALVNLTLVEKELNKLEVTCIPDTDISIKVVECKKKEVEKAINQLKTVRAKKVVHL
jgi:bla regulator protein BlaR1